jgi:hypothetical protein
MHDKRKSLCFALAGASALLHLLALCSLRLSVFFLPLLLLAAPAGLIPIALAWKRSGEFRGLLVLCAAVILAYWARLLMSSPW